MDLYVSQDAAEALMRSGLGEKWATTLQGMNRARKEEHNLQKLGFRTLSLTFGRKTYKVHVVGEPACTGMRNDTLYRKDGNSYTAFGKFRLS